MVINVNVINQAGEETCWVKVFSYTEVQTAIRRFQPSLRLGILRNFNVVNIQHSSTAGVILHPHLARQPILKTPGDHES